LANVNGERRKAYRSLLENPERKRQFGRYKRRWDGNSNTCFREVTCEGVDWIDLAQDRYKYRDFVKNVMKFRVKFTIREIS
jgi:hypothetical protein